MLNVRDPFLKRSVSGVERNIEVEEKSAYPESDSARARDKEAPVAVALRSQFPNSRESLI
jgi:hypothetical protein